MDISLQFAFIFGTYILAMFGTEVAMAIEGLQGNFKPLTMATTTTTPSSPSSPPPTPQELQEHSFFSHTALLPPILSHLGFHELATAAPSLSESPASTSSAWTGPTTIFAPSDDSIRSCFSCSIPSLLREHIVPGLFTMDYLRRLAFGTKIETLSPGRCITVTSDSINGNSSTASNSKVFIGGVEITQPELFNNGMVAIHGIQGFVAPLSPYSCDVERITPLSFPYHPDHRYGQYVQSGSVQSAMMRLMLRDAMLRLRNNGFSILALAMKVKYAELVTLNNMTVFAVDDFSIFSGSHSYISNVRFHIVPNHYLTMADLEKLPVGTPLPSLERGQTLIVTTSGGGLTAAPMRINYVRIKVPDVVHNIKIAVHSVYLPFPHINPLAAAYDSILGGEGDDHESVDQVMDGTCGILDGNESCGESPMPSDQTTVEIEDHHGL